MNAPRTHTRWLDAESSDLVAAFWAAANEVEPFPRNLARPVALALPVTIIRIPRLSLRDAEAWLRRYGVPVAFAEDARGHRAVHGCILARAGHGFIFVDGADGDADLRFTIAHEVGHFLADHQLPRRRAEHRFGAAILDVLDGRRPPTRAERLRSALDDLPLTQSASFLPRSDSAEGGLDLWRVESRADRIGAALLAPPDLVLAAARGATYSERLAAARGALEATFGFPPAPALHYAQVLLQENGLGHGWAETLRRPA